MNLQLIDTARNDSNFFSEKEKNHLNSIYLFLEKIERFWELPLVKESNITSFGFSLTPALYADIDDFTFDVNKFHVNKNPTDILAFDRLMTQIEGLGITKSLRELDFDSMPYGGNLETYDFYIKKDTSIEDILSDNLLNDSMLTKIWKLSDILELSSSLEKETLVTSKKNKI